jgi:hypothetical protein
MITFPIVRYSGFHPGFMSSVNYRGRPIPSADIGYHSTIAVAAFIMGMTAKQAFDLYNPEVMRRLGFLGQPDHWRSQFLEYCRTLGYEFHNALTFWLRDGPFMYTTVHPAIRVLSAIARAALKKAGIEGLAPTGLTDHLGQNVCLPCLPPLADHIGITGSWEFKRAVKQHGENRAMHLGDYLEQVWQTYASLPGEALDAPIFRRTVETLRRMDA